MNSRKGSGSGIFLMEMIMVCGFFLLCAAVCIRVFIQADSMSRLARETNQAVLAAESLADGWKAGVFEEEDFLSEGEGFVFWDENWNRLEQADQAWYSASLTTVGEGQGQNGGLEDLEIRITRGDGHPRRLEKDRDGEKILLFSLQAKRYIPSGGESDGEK